MIARQVDVLVWGTIGHPADVRSRHRPDACCFSDVQLHLRVSSSTLVPRFRHTHTDPAYVCAALMHSSVNRDSAQASTMCLPVNLCISLHLQVSFPAASSHTSAARLIHSGDDV